MILEYSVENTLSIKEKQTISFEAVQSKETDEIHVVNYGNKKFLKMACIYGANASGKTNMETALSYYLGFILNSFIELKPEEKTLFVPFMFDEKGKNNPGKFNIIFYTNDFDNKNNIIRYEYNLTLNQKEVIEESLFYSPKGQSKRIFERKKGEEILWGTSVTGAKKIIADLTRPNCSLIGAGAQANHPIFTFIYKHFFYRLKPIIHPYSNELTEITLNKIDKDENFKKKVIELLQAADFGSISDFNINTEPVQSTFVIHHYEKDYKLPLDYESAGTRRILELIAPLYSLRKSSLVLIDEIESSLHQVLLEMFIELYLRISTDSQLIFTTHNQDLLESNLLRDDEVWFCYKTNEGNSIYNSITDFTGIRKEVSRKKLYEAGKFGSLPIIDMEKLIRIFNAEKN